MLVRFSHFCDASDPIGLGSGAFLRGLGRAVVHMCYRGFVGRTPAEKHSPFRSRAAGRALITAAPSINEMIAEPNTTTRGGDHFLGEQLPLVGGYL